MKYLVHLHTDYWIAKNKLQSEYKRVAKQVSGTLLQDESELALWLDIFENWIEIVNAKHPRCKPISLSTHVEEDPDDTLECRIICSNVFEIHVIRVKREGPLS